MIGNHQWKIAGPFRRFHNFVVHRMCQLTRRSIWLRSVILVGFVSCIDPLPSRYEQTQSILVVDGLISNQPGPYTVRLSLANASLTLFNFMKPLPEARVEICDDLQTCESLREIQPGVYQTRNMIGVVGRSYRLKIRTREGREYQSLPDKLSAPGTIDQLRYEVVDLPSDGFNVYADAKLPESDSAVFMKFDWNGAYEVLGFPGKKMVPLLIRNQEVMIRVPGPPECSGLEFIIRATDPVLDTTLRRRGPCVCCSCWIEDQPSLPVVAESTYFTSSFVSNVLVTRVPINRRTMYKKYELKVVAQSISRSAYAFWSAIRAQKLGATDLFQPPIGYVPGNISGITNPEEKVVGIFYAAAASDTSLLRFSKDMVPYKLLPIDTITEDCRKGFTNATTQKPFGW